jgi:Tfp pilus assembly protein PilO
LAGNNYSYKKHQRELAQKKKREEKLKNKLAKKNSQSGVVTDQFPGI